MKMLLEAMWWVDELYMGEEADPIRLNVYVRQ